MRKQKTYSKSEKEEFLNMYVSGLSVSYISKEFGIPRTTLGNWITKEDLSRNKKLRKEEVSIIEKLYLEGSLAKDIAEIVGLSESGVTYHLRNMGISRHNGVQSLTKREDYFETIDTEEKAYWLGFIMADGSVGIHNGQYSMKISLSVKDRIILERFASAVDSSNKIWERDEVFKLKTSSSYGKVFRKCCISISSKRMVESLFAHGVVLKKTGCESIPDIDEALKPHFLRGFFDGDGTASYTPSRFCGESGYTSPSYSFGFISCEKMLMDIQQFTGIEEKIYKRVGCYSFSYGKKKGRELYDIMYANATIWLPRKREVMNEALGISQNHNDNEMMNTAYAKKNTMMGVVTA